MKKMKNFTAWGKNGIANTLVDGIDPPTFVNGTPMPDCKEKIFTIQAETWEEAMAIYNQRMGFEPYNPVGQPGNCPTCGSIFYPHGSGECWNCKHKI